MQLLGQGHGKYFMLAEAVTVFLALIGTTLACMNTGARVTYAMGKDDEAPEHFGMLHAKTLTRTALCARCPSSPPSSAASRSRWYSETVRRPPMPPSLRCPTASSPAWDISHDHSGKHAQLAADDHPGFQLRNLHPVRAELHPVHGGVPQPPGLSFCQAQADPGFGLLANVGCMAFYLIGPFLGIGTKGALLGRLSSRSYGAATEPSTL
jgi:APA family basic amino acid/polyamine antiporter